MNRHAPSTVQEAWLAALEDAGIPEHDAVLFRVDHRDSYQGLLALMWRRDSPVEMEAESLDIGLPFSALNDEAIRSKARVVLWRTPSVIAVAGCLRHELEHYMQLDNSEPELYELYRTSHTVMHALSRGRLYNDIPMEADANAAASRFVRDTFLLKDVEARAKAPDHERYRALLRPHPPVPPITSLPERMEVFIDDTIRKLDALGIEWADE